MRRLPLYAALLACVGFSGACAGIDKALAKELQALAEAEPGGETHLGASPFVRRPWAEGQWVEQAVRDGKVWSVQRVSIVGSEGDSFWLEMRETDPRSKENPERMKMKISGYDAADPSSVSRLQIGEVILANGDQPPMRAPPFVGPAAAAGVLSGFDIDTTSATTTTTQVPAGTFTDCAQLTVEVEWGPIRVEQETWLHSAVPIWGIVRSASTDGKHETVLLDFGESGAVSEIGEPTQPW